MPSQAVIKHHLSSTMAKRQHGKVRVCIHPRPLKEALHRSNYPLPAIEDILPELGKARVFSKADLKDGFLSASLPFRHHGANIVG